MTKIFTFDFPVSFEGVRKLQEILLNLHIDPKVLQGRIKMGLTHAVMDGEVIERGTHYGFLVIEKGEEVEFSFCSLEVVKRIEDDISAGERETRIRKNDWWTVLGPVDNLLH